MNHKIELVWALPFVLVAGCTQMKPMPLVFVSTSTLGVDIGADPSSAQTPRLVLGYKVNDVALVPVTSEPSQGDPIRGCYNTVKNMSGITACADVVGSSPGKEEGPKDKLPVDKAMPIEKPNGQSSNKLKWRAANMLNRSNFISGSAQDSHWITDSTGHDGVNVAQLGEKMKSAIPIDFGPGPQQKQNSIQKQGKTAVGQNAIPITPDGGSSSYGQSMRDSLSVFSSFNTEAKVGAEGGVQLGKAFATGVAAQQLTEGINYYMQLKGRALASGTMSETNKGLLLRNECVKSLIAAKDRNIPIELLPNCSEKSQQTQDELNAKTACVKALTAATEKNVSTDKLPKCG